MEAPGAQEPAAAFSPPTSSEDDSEAETAALEARVSVLEAKLSTPTYEVLLELLKAYRTLGDLPKLRATRQQFHRNFPLSHDLWVEWFEDEKQLAQTLEEKAEVVSLLQKAALDYFSVDIYVKKIEYMLAVNHPDVEIAMDEAIHTAGYDLAASHALWTLCLNTTKRSEKKKEWLALLPKIPLMNFDYQAWGISTNDQIERVIEARKDLEEVVAGFPAAARVPGNGQNDKELTKAWYSYIQLELAKRPGFCERRARTVFERAVSCCCLSGGLWERYVEFIDASNGKETVKARLQVYRRATRNCPWDVKLWVSYIRALERAGQEIGPVLFEALQKSFQSPQAYYQLIMAACEQRRRAFEQSSCSKESVIQMYDYGKDFLRKHHPSYLTAQLGLFVSRMKVEYYLFQHDVKDKWLRYLAGEPAAQPYVKALSFFYTLRDWDTYRKVAKQAITALHNDKEGLESVCNAWKSMEKEFGSLEDLYSASVKTSSALRELRKRSSREHGSKRQIRSKTKDTPVATSPKKRNREHEEDLKRKRQKVSKDSNPKVPKGSNQEASSAEMGVVKDTKEEKPKGGAVFVINLKYGLSDAKLAEFFEICGSVAAATVLKGRNKGRGKVEFDKAESVEKALAMTGTPLEGLPVKVLPFKGDKAARKRQTEQRKKQHVAEKLVAAEDRASTVLVSCLAADACSSLQQGLKGGQLAESFVFGKRFQDIGQVKESFVAQNLTSLVVTFDNVEAASRALELSQNEDLCTGEGAMKPRRIKVTKYGEIHTQSGTVNPRKSSKKHRRETPKTGKGRQRNDTQIRAPARTNEDFRQMLLKK